MLDPYEQALDTRYRLYILSDSDQLLPPTKKTDVADPTRGGTPHERRRYRAGLDILSQTNERHFAAFGTGVRGRGLCP